MVSKEVKVFDYVESRRMDGYLKIFSTDDGTYDEVYVEIKPDGVEEPGQTLRVRIDDIYEALGAFNNTRPVHYIPRSYNRRDGGDD